MIRVNNLCLELGSKAILQRVSLDIKAGKKLAVLGANGAGKSTLLKCITQEENRYRGGIYLADSDIRQYPAAERARIMGVMPQKTELAFPFRAQQVVAMGRIPYGDEMRCDALIRDAMLCTDVWHLRHRLYPQLSGGEQQRVQLARVLLQIWQPFQEQPRFLLLDECTSALDPAHQHAVMSVADRFAQQGVAVLAVMHDVALAASWADDIIMLKHGQVLASGGVELLQQAALLQQAYDLEASLASRYAHQNQQWASFNRLPVDRQTA